MMLRMHTPETIVGGKRLGRIVAHDPRSLKYPAKMVSGDIKTTEWERRVPVFDQGSLGSCTGNACAGMLSTEPFTRTFGERDAVALYSKATHIDRIKGTYPPADTGSSGLAVLKAAVALGYAKGYEHAFGFEHMLRALMLRPGIMGISWLTGCDNPDKHGIVRYEGVSRGGHEFEAYKVDVENQLVWFWNSWGPNYGVGGRFAMSWEDCEKALRNRGDVTFANV